MTDVGFGCVLDQMGETHLLVVLVHRFCGDDEPILQLRLVCHHKRLHLD
jgi:hypothetical protein